MPAARRLAAQPGGTGLETRLNRMQVFKPATSSSSKTTLKSNMIREVHVDRGLSCGRGRWTVWRRFHLLRTVRHRAPDTPCLILLDLKMPRLGGNECRHARLGDPTVANVPVAVMSGATDLEQRAAAMGAVATLPKPLDVDVLIDVVKLLLRSSGGESGPAGDSLTHGGDVNTAPSAAAAMTSAGTGRSSKR